MATAKTAEQQILWSINKWEYMSWGIRQKSALEYEGMATLALRVSGAVHKGWVFISLNEGKDCYEVRLLNVARTKVKRTLDEVYCDNLGQVLDGLIERKAEWADAQYKDKAVRDSARKMGMEVIDVSKKKAEPMVIDGVRYRPATLEEIDGRDVDLYMNGERVYVLMVCRSETIETGESKLDYITLTNMKKVQVEDLYVIDNDNNEPNKEDQTMKLNLSNNNENESGNVQNNAQVNNNASEPIVKQVDVMGLMGALSRDGHAKLSDHVIEDAEAVEVKDEQAEEIESVNVGEVTLATIMPKMQVNEELRMKNEECHVVGLITDGDIRRAMEKWQAEFFNRTVSDIMTRTPKSVRPETKITEIQRIMSKYKVHSVLVTDEENHLLGVVDHYSCMI